MYIDKFFENYDSPTHNQCYFLVTVLKDMMNILGLNFLSNFIPFFHHWVMKVTEPVISLKDRNSKILLLILFYITC